MKTKTTDRKPRITIVLPERSEDIISKDLRRLTQVLCVGQIGDDHDGSGGLGGTYGYGVNYENDVFMIHRYCWCERPECPWCLECACQAHYEKNGVRVERYEEGVESITDVECRNSREQPERAPNFLHKPSGSTIRWYKWIGRSMEMELRGEWSAIVAECLESIKGPDSDRVFVARDGRARRVEDLPDGLRREVEEALVRAVDPETLPSNESLAEASRILGAHVRDLPAGRRIALTTAVARGLVDLEVKVREKVRAAHQPPLTTERFAALMCPNCLLYSNSAEIPSAINHGLARASQRARDVLVRIWGEAEVIRRQDVLAMERMWISRGTLQPPPLPARGVKAGGGTADSGEAV